MNGPSVLTPQAQSNAVSPWPVFWIASVAVFLVSIDVTVLYAAFPALRLAFPDAHPTGLSWVLNAYTLVFAALLVPAGRLADLRGRKRTFLLGLAMFLAGSFGCGIATRVEMLWAMRAVQGAGAALLLPASLSILLAAFPVNKRAIAVSLWGAVSGVAGALGRVSARSWSIASAGRQPSFSTCRSGRSRSGAGGAFSTSRVIPSGARRSISLASCC